MKGGCVGLLTGEIRPGSGISGRENMSPEPEAEAEETEAKRERWKRVWRKRAWSKRAWVKKERWKRWEEMNNAEAEGPGLMGHKPRVQPLSALGSSMPLLMAAGRRVHLTHLGPTGLPHLPSKR